MLKNAKHEHFAHLIAKGESPAKAYVIAGYSEQGALQSGNRLLRNADVSARIAQIRETIERPAIDRAIEKTGIDKAWVMAELVEVVKMAKAAEPVRDANGEPIGEFKQNLAAANKALELIGKEFSMFIDRKEVRTGPLDSLEHDELKELQSVIDEISGSSKTVARSTRGTTH